MALKSDSYRSDNPSPLFVTREGFGRRGLFFIIVLFGVFSSSNVAPSLFGDAIFAGSIGTLMVYGVLTNETRIAIRRWVLAVLSVIVLLLLFHVIRDPLAVSLSNTQLIRVPIVLLIFFPVLFYFPKIVDVRFAMNSIAIVSSTIVLLGVPALVIGPYSIGWIDIAPYTDFRLPVTGQTVPALTSFYGDSNAVSKAAMFGAFAGLYLEVDSSSFRSKGLFGICILGLYLGHSRGAMIAFLGGIGVFAAYRLANENIGRLSLSTLIIGSLVGFGMLAGLLPAPAFIETIPLSSRGKSWEAALTGIAEQPILGYGLLDPGSMIAPYITPALRGLSPQNSFLYMYLATGLVGGTAYSLFIIGALFTWSNLASPGEYALIGAGVAIYVLHFFEMITLFAANQNSLFATIFLGYLLANRPIASSSSS